MNKPQDYTNDLLKVMGVKETRHRGVPIIHKDGKYVINGYIEHSTLEQAKRTIDAGYDAIEKSHERSKNLFVENLLNKD